jgi:hypothetical protein
MTASSGVGSFKHDHHDRHLKPFNSQDLVGLKPQIRRQMEIFAEVSAILLTHHGQI